MEAEESGETTPLRRIPSASPTEEVEAVAVFGDSWAVGRHTWPVLLGHLRGLTVLEV